jgi:hypothetical protein
MCHRVGDWQYRGYCNVGHMERGVKDEMHELQQDILAKLSAPVKNRIKTTHEKATQTEAS